MYAAGRLTHEEHLAALGLHGTEALVVGELVGGVMKGFIGRAAAVCEAAELPQLRISARLRGGRPTDRFHPGTPLAAFAAAAAVSSETAGWWPETRWIIGPVLVQRRGAHGDVAHVRQPALGQRRDRRRGNRHVRGAQGRALLEHRTPAIASTRCSSTGSLVPERRRDTRSTGRSCPASLFPPGRGHVDAPARMTRTAKSGIFIIAPIPGPMGDRIAALQEAARPANPQAWPPHVTLAGLVGHGPDRREHGRRAELEAAPRRRSRPTRRPSRSASERPTRFMQTEIVVLPLDPHGPLRALHERIKTERPAQRTAPLLLHAARDAQPLPRAAAGRAEFAAAWKFDDPVVHEIEAHLTRDTGESTKLLTLPLAGS